MLETEKMKTKNQKNARSSTRSTTRSNTRSSTRSSTRSNTHSNEVALVLEGGGMRGMFTGGVVDTLLENQLTNFSHVYGVSAGAINGTNFLGHDTGRFCRDVLAFRDNPDFFSFYSLAKTGNVMGREFIFKDVNNDIDPFSYEVFNKNPTPYTVVASDVTFGTPVYLDVKQLPRDMDAIVASSSLPTLSEIVEYKGKRLLDGGTTDSIPVEKALADGAKKLVVVLTQDRSYIRPEGYSLMSVAATRYYAYPYFIEALRTRPERYNAQRKFIFELEAAGKALVIAPSKPVNLSLIGQDGSDLLRLYVDGMRQTNAVLKSIQKFLN